MISLNQQKSRLQNERKFQQVMRDEWRRLGNWSQDTSPGHGSVDGLPDVMFLFGDSLVFAELKVGVLAKDNTTLLCREIRPSQRRWASKFRHHGGKCGLVVGVQSSDRSTGLRGWRCFLIDPSAWLSSTKTRFLGDQYDEFWQIDHVLAAITERADASDQTRNRGGL